MQIRTESFMSKVFFFHGKTFKNVHCLALRGSESSLVGKNVISRENLFHERWIGSLSNANG